MKDVTSVLKELGAKNGVEMDLDENGACTLELADGRVMLIQERADLGELDFVATLGPVPEEVRALVERAASPFFFCVLGQSPAGEITVRNAPRTIDPNDILRESPSRGRKLWYNNNQF